MNILQCNMECNRINKITQDKSLRDKCFLMRSSVVRERYGLGGEMLHRGYYCPSVVIDIVIGNVKRGKVFDSISSQSKPSYIYGFDNDDQLITVETRTNFEAVFRANNCITSVILNKTFGDIESVSECSYFNNGKIKDYCMYLCQTESNEVTSFKKETYTYLHDQLLVDVHEFVRENEILIHETYVFSLVDGFLSSYTVEDHDDHNKETCESQRYDVKISRQV